MKILALTKYDFLAASSRYRFRQFVPALAAAGFTVDFAPLLPNAHVQGLVTGERLSALRIGRSYIGRALKLLGARHYDVIWVQYELFPYLPKVFEHLIGICGSPVVLDYDDAIFHLYHRPDRPWMRRLLGGKLDPLMKRAAACLCGNAYVHAYASRHCPQTIIVPTVVDTNDFRPAETADRQSPLTIGWLGSPTTWRNLAPLLPLIAELCDRHGLHFLAVGAGRDAQEGSSTRFEFRDWDEFRELGDLQSMDIGIMPVNDQPFERGKSGFKLIQYMAVGLPVVASPVGANREIVDQGETGFLASSMDQWREALERLIADSNLRARLGQAGRAKAVKLYSLDSQAPRVVGVFRLVSASLR